MKKPMNAEDAEDAGALLKRILSPADAQSLVMPPPDHAPYSGPGESTPLTGNLAAAPTQATPARQGLAGYFSGKDPNYVKVSSHGHIGYLPRANLIRAKQIDPQMQLLEP